MEQGPTEPHTGRGTFLLSFGGAEGEYYCVAVDMRPIPTEKQFPCGTPVACLAPDPNAPLQGTRFRTPPPPSGFGADR